MENQRLDCIYDDEPLGFEKYPMGPGIKMQAEDPLEEVDLGDGIVKRPTYISTKIDKEFKAQIVELLKKIQRLFSLGLSWNAKFEARCCRAQVTY